MHLWNQEGNVSLLPEQMCCYSEYVSRNMLWSYSVQIQQIVHVLNVIMLCTNVFCFNIDKGMWPPKFDGTLKSDDHAIVRWSAPNSNGMRR